MDAHQPIGIFDSGIGGLTVVREIQSILPDETLCYFGDTARVPYGTKSAETVIRYSEEICELLKTYRVKMIVAACNTASSVAIHAIQQRFPGPVIGMVEPGVHAAVKATKTNRIGIIGTKSTINSGSYLKGIKQACPSAEVISQACPLFVPLAEEGWYEGNEVAGIANHYLNPMKDFGIDTLILGCTHYPLLHNIIQSVMGDKVTLISSALEAARSVRYVLQGKNALSSERKREDIFLASDDIIQFQSHCERISPCQTQGIFTRSFKMVTL